VIAILVALFIIKESYNLMCQGFFLPFSIPHGRSRDKDLERHLTDMKDKLSRPEDAGWPEITGLWISMLRFPEESVGNATITAI
jgi:hypothetical protein